MRRVVPHIIYNSLPQINVIQAAFKRQTKGGKRMFANSKLVCKRHNNTCWQTVGEKKNSFFVNMCYIGLQTRVANFSWPCGGKRLYNIFPWQYTEFSNRLYPHQKRIWFWDIAYLKKWIVWLCTQHTKVNATCLGVSSKSYSLTVSRFRVEHKVVILLRPCGLVNYHVLAKYSTRVI